MKFSANALDILYEDNHLLAINKPKGLLTQPTPTQAESLETLAKTWIKTKYQKKGNVFLHPIHRLDKPVSGIVLFARTSKALSRLNSQMREHLIEKTYLAEVEGLLEKSSGELFHHLARTSYRTLVQKNSKGGEGKPAHLSYTVLKEESHSTHVLITLHTGRYHQIRAQFAHIGHPIIGDVKYGAKKTSSSSIALHHAILTFYHPITNQKLTIQSQSDY
ncbi:MAG: RluA family pseudouridine synthase [Chlamydiia bacterium]|nr:RluA family pseudouridine synthase [Chlamydiia bacterium]